jgi:antitoxin PrlF
MGYTLTTKSQVTLPKPIRDHLKVAPGDAVEFRIAADGSVRVDPVRALRRVKDPAVAKALARFKGLVGIGGHSGEASTDRLMALLRGYDEDASDPGFAPASAPAKKQRPTR